MDKERENKTKPNSLVDKCKIQNNDPMSKVADNGESTASKEKLKEKLQILPFAGKAEPPDLSDADFSDKVLAENLVPEIAHEISVKTEIETLAPSVEDQQQSVPLDAEQRDSFNDIPLGEGTHPEIELGEKTSSLLTVSTSITNALATFSEPDPSSFEETDGGESRKKHCSTTTRSANPGKINCHNLSVSELRRKLSACPICQFHYGNYKLATVCLTKHGKRQCWLCLEILSTKKQDYYRHCVEYHFVSSTGENVGCPFCAKFFDFRQGLNQHIVKIHFAESISDFNAVASLSPKTLVDIYTGQPREPSPISSATITPSKSQESICEEEAIPNELPVAVRSIFENEFKALDCSGGDLPSSSSSTSVEVSSTILPLPTVRLKDGVVSNRQAFPNLNKLVMLSSSNSTPRTSVITLSSRSPPQKMIVPPEQTMSSLAEEFAIRDVGPLMSSVPFDNSHQHFQQQFIPGHNPYPGQNPSVHEHNVQIVDNTGLKFLPEASSFNYDFGRNPPPAPILFFPPTTEMSRVESDPEKFETSFYPDYSQKSKFQEGAMSTATATATTSSYGGGDNGLTSSFEKDIIQVNSDNLERVNASEDNNGLSSLRSFGSRPSNEGENELSCFSEAEKNYLDSITRMLETSTELGFNSGIMEENGSQSANMVGGSLPVEASAGAGDITDNSNLKDGNNLNPEIGGAHTSSNEPPKSLNNCGVKRRILMKAMRDEQNQQFKRPAFPDTHALVHDLHASTYYLTQPVSSSQKMATPSNPQKVKRGYNEVCFGAKPKEHLGPPKQEPTIVSQVQMINHAGPFFEQYVKQDKIRSRESHHKSCTLAITSISTGRPPEFAHDPTQHTSTSVAPSWTTSGGGCLRLDPNRACMLRANAPRPPGQWQAPVHPSPTFTRPQFPTPHQVHVRRPPNTAFWDNLRARLEAQNRYRTSESCTFSRSNEQPQLQPRSSCAFEIPRLENVTVQNPFEEEANSLKKTRQVSPIPSHLNAKLGHDVNRLQLAVPDKNMSPLDIGNFQPPQVPLHAGRELLVRHQHPRHPCHSCHPLLRANPPCPVGMPHSCCNPMMGHCGLPCNNPVFQPPFPPPIPLTIYQAQLQHRHMMEQCGRHGFLRNINPQSYNRYRGDFRQGFNRF